MSQKDVLDQLLALIYKIKDDEKGGGKKCTPFLFMQDYTDCLKFFIDKR